MKIDLMLQLFNQISICLPLTEILCLILLFHFSNDDNTFTLDEAREKIRSCEDEISELKKELAKLKMNKTKPKNEENRYASSAGNDSDTELICLT